MSSSDKKAYDSNPKGCYLTFAHESLGVLFEQWSEKATDFKEEVFAFFKPTKKVPTFKYNKKGGKSEIIRELQAKNIKRYYIGWTHFLKTAKEYKAEVTIYRTKDVQVYFLTSNGDVKSMDPNKAYNLCDLKISAIAAVPKNAETFDGVKSISFGSFMENANKVGASLAL
ncbi:hypothetical protein AAMO2058_000002700 [Amorphochlora amoebiformis]|mmetsp:Transcript_34729/g.56016  ORF Transcript_34729/g.56016 Transcript_34729/m.56016 type:complete len:170 (-) Transcript_34729:331-840(-)